MYRLIFRPLLIFLTLLALVVALLQVGGRLTFWFLDDLEAPVNRWLSGQQIRLTGLSGDWRMLNPVFQVERADTAAGYVTDLYVEVDWLESLLRNTLVARRIDLGGGELVLERADSGWRLRGAGAALPIDVANLVYHSDELNLRATLVFDAQPDGVGDPLLTAADGLAVHYLAANRGGVHRHRFTLENSAPDCADCAVVLGYDAEEEIWLARERTESVVARGGGVVLPPALAATPALRLDRLAVQWRRARADSTGNLEISFSGLDLGSDNTISGGLKLESAGHGDAHHGYLSEFHLRDPEGRLDFPPVRMNYEHDLVQWWMPRLDLGEVLDFLATRVAQNGPAGRWLNGLGVAGEALNVRGYVRVPDARVGYAATIRALDINAFAGAPMLRGAGGELVGYGAGVQMQLNAQDVDLQFPGLFHQRWVMDHAQGILQAWFSSDYFAMRGRNMRLLINSSLASGGFALTRPRGQPLEDRLTLMVNIDKSSISGAKQFVPFALPAGLPEWLEDGPRSGDLSDVAFAYHGHLKTRPFELSRRVELTTDITRGHVRYHPDWPDLVNFDGEVAVAGREVRINVERGFSEGGAALDGSRVVLGNNVAYADIVLATQTSVEDALAFVRRTPLAQWMSFITPDWRGEGLLTLEGTLHIPLQIQADHIGETSFDEEVAVDLRIGMTGVDLELPEYRVTLEGMDGMVTYEYPYNLQGADVSGRIFGQPAVFAADSDDNTVIFHVAGQARYEDVLDMLEIADPGVLAGSFNFLADLHVEVGADEVSRLEVSSDLTGLGLELPGEFAKRPEEAVATGIVIRFLDSYQALSFRHRSATGWLHVDDIPLRGGIGFSVPPPLFASTARELLLAGRVEGFALADVIPDGDEDPNLLLPVRLADFTAGYVDVEDVRFSEVSLQGVFAPESLVVNIQSPSVEGDIELIGDAPMRVHLSKLVMPAGGEEGEDPLDVSIIAELPNAEVLVDQLTVGEKDYGSWSFNLVPDESGVAMTQLEAHVRGIAISSPGGVYWQAETNESQFEGSLLVADLAQVLPLWDFAPTLTTQSAQFNGALNWRGSPANVEVERLIGDASFVASNGRFLEVDAGGQGAMKIFSLVNFSTVLKRLKFDFSDVAAEGISFDSINATARFDEGLMTFVEPIDIQGSGSNFKIAGQVDLVAGTLDNEMIVTLPVTRSLPWYAAYVALASPLTAIGVIVGERVLRKPIEQFSSAKYQISGSIEDPQLEFVNVWDTSVDEPQETLEEAEEPVPLSDAPVADSVRSDES